MRKKKVVLIYGGNVKRQFWNENGVTEIWGCNAITKSWIPAISRMFNLHKFTLLKRYKYPFNNDRILSSKVPELPYVVADAWPKGWLQRQVIFPYKQIAAMPRGDYHCGSFDWMVAYAVLVGATEIRLHGIGLCLEAGEPISARACLEYWLGYAEGKGIKVVTAGDCDFFHFYHLVKSKLQYGIQDTPIFEDRTKKGVDYHYGE